MSVIAHGLVGRQDLPIPEWLFGWAAALVLVVSFVALAFLWPRPKLEHDVWRPLGERFGRAVTSPAVELVCGAIGVFLLGVTVWAGLAGVETASANFTPSFVYVIFWLGLIPLSLLLGDVFRAFNPWRALARAVSWVAQRFSGGKPPAPLPYPDRLGNWPAAMGLAGFAWMELAYSSGDSPRSLAIATLVYSAATFVAMALYGIEPWIRRGEAFSVYFNLYSRLAVFERRERRIGLRRPLAGLAAFTPVAGTVALLAVMIGSVTFDGLSGKPLWSDVAPEIGSVWDSLGFSPERANELTFTVGLLACIALVWAFYRLGIAGARTVGGGFSGPDLARRFVHSLVPIALVYAAAHYLTLLLYQGQSIVYLASNPLGHDWDLFGTADRAIDYSVIGATATWYYQVAFVVLGHVAALILAHDRALVLYDDAKRAVRSQYWMLAIMIGFTSLALWLLSQSNQ